MREDLVLGVDGGGTGSRAIVADMTGNIHTVQTGPACNYQNSDPRQTQKVLSNLLHRTIENLSVSSVSVVAAVFGLAGLDTSSDARVLEQIVRSALQVNHMDALGVQVENDGVVTLYGAVGSGPGVMILSGTGSIAWGVAPGQQPVRSGGWGHRLGDEGSGYDIGRAALMALMRAYDGRGPETNMRDHLLPVLGFHREEELAEWAYSEQYSVSSVAKLAPIVLSLADRGNPAATFITKRAAEDLANLGMSVVRHMGLQNDLRIAFSGGILENHPLLRRLVADQLSQRLAAQSIRSRMTVEAFPSALGSTACALRSCGADILQVLPRLRSAYARISAEQVPKDVPVDQTL
ncbi:MAG: hypothetical protein K6T78_13930 [Alicyclobacillus sp.]|nr:hypothetical protein [Alicyclobacillus sp.]